MNFQCFPIDEDMKDRAHHKQQPHDLVRDFSKAIEDMEKHHQPGNAYHREHQRDERRDVISVQFHLVSYFVLRQNCALDNLWNDNICKLNLESLKKALLLYCNN